MQDVFGTGSASLTGPIIDGVTVRQGFTAILSKLDSIGINFGTYCRLNPGQMTVAVYDVRDNSIVTKVSAMVSLFTDNAYYDFALNCELIPGRTYELRIYTLDCRSGGGVTSRYKRKLHNHHLFIGARLIKDAELDCRFNYHDDASIDVKETSELNVDNERPVKASIPGLISVVIPHLNCQGLLAKCLASLTRQTYNAIEAIVVDDGSEDPILTQAVVQSYGPLISTRFLHLEDNMGSPTARNTGAEYASGDYLIFVDADVVMYPDSFERMIDILIENQNVDISYGGFRWGGEVMEPLKWDVDRLLGGNYISTMSMMRKAKFPGWDENLKRHQDWDLWLTMVNQGCEAMCTERLMFETPRRPGSISTDGNIDMMKSIDIVRRKHGL